MIKRTLYFGNPAYLSRKDEQLVIKLPEEKKVESEENNDNDEQEKNEKYKERLVQNTVPIEDIGIVILDNQQTTLTQGLIAGLLENNAALITCDNTHHPTGMLLTLSGNNLQSEKFQEQIESSIPLRKQLWQQTITAKIINQASLLKRKKVPVNNMLLWAKKVRSGDPDNYEGRAAAYYWGNLFPKELEFKRDRYGMPPNNLLNYGYAILRAIIARSLVASGLLPTLGIHHHNKYNSYCLADDIMEPFRPFVDEIVCALVENGEDFYELTPSIKKQLLEIATKEIIINGEKSPLMVGAQRTTSSLSKCYAGELRKIYYPELK
ncbi:MAG: type II CRISPR-associated endonuclease Cas1 [Ignavibacteriales bacterium]|nr:type II CRISPR-associated endonuclease Cas1 [Ignavibacteriales bacterium]